MTGLDCLREEMERRGYSKSQTESKTVGVVLDILSNNNDIYSAIVNEEKEQSKVLSELNRVIRNATVELNMLKAEISSLRIKRGEIEKKEKDFDEYVNKVKQQLYECDTEQGRDTIRKAQMFINSVNVNSKYDNTAYIIALGAILSGGKYDGIESLKEINPKLFGGKNEN